MKKTTYYLLFLFLSMLAACESEDAGNTEKKEGATTSENTELNGSEVLIKETDQEPNVVISGNVKNGGKSSLVLEANLPNQALRIAQTFTDENGNFLLSGAIEDMGLYQLRLEERQTQGKEPKVVPLTLVPNDSVNIQLDFNTFNQTPHFSGTEWSEPLNGYFKEMQKFVEWQKSVENPNQYGQDELMNMVMENKKPMDEFTIQSIKENPMNPANILLMTNLLPMMGYEYWDAKNLEVLKKLHKAFEEKYPEHPMTRSMGTQIAESEVGFKEFVEFTKNNKAPEIEKRAPDGSIKKLTDLRGKYVLIDFWASWCGPCRMENPNVVRVYNQYKDKGFDIFSVSLDQDKGRWTKAIEADGLIWENHVSDLQGWQSDVVRQYNFNGIPHTVLIDPEGKIVATNLRGPSLEKKLKELLGA